MLVEGNAAVSAITQKCPLSVGVGLLQVYIRGNLDSALHMLLKQRFLFYFEVLGWVVSISIIIFIFLDHYHLKEGFVPSMGGNITFIPLPLALGGKKNRVQISHSW